MDLIYILLVIVVASILQSVMAKLKRRRNKRLSESEYIIEDQESYQHILSSLGDDPYDFNCGNSSEEFVIQEQQVSLRDGGIVEKRKTQESPPKYFDRNEEDSDNAHDILDNFDVEKAILYTEIIKPKF